MTRTSEARCLDPQGEVSIMRPEWARRSTEYDQSLRSKIGNPKWYSKSF